MHEYKCNSGSGIISDGKQEEHFLRIYLPTCWDTKLGLFFILFLFLTSNTEYFFIQVNLLAFHHFLSSSCFFLNNSETKEIKKVSSFQIFKHIATVITWKCANITQLLQCIEYHGRVNSYTRRNGTWYAILIYFMVKRAVEHDSDNDGV